MQGTAGARLLTNDDSLRLLEEKALKKQKELEEKEQRKKIENGNSKRNLKICNRTLKPERERRKNVRKRKRSVRNRRSIVTNRRSNPRKQGGTVSESNGRVHRRWELLTATLYLVWTVLKNMAVRISQEKNEQE